MGHDTNIPFAHHTFSPWIGCTHVSEGCRFCFAEAVDARFHGGGHWGFGKPRMLVKDWHRPRAYDKQAGRKVLAGMRKEKRFVLPTLCDPFDTEVPIEWFSDFMRLIQETPNLVWLLQTKRPQSVIERCNQVNSLSIDGRVRLPENAAIGISIEDQETADARLPHLEQIRSLDPLFTFLSCEPLLGLIDLRAYHGAFTWVVVGGESGSRFRPCEVAWIEQIANQCVAAEIPVFVKQDCGLKTNERGRLWDELWALKQLPKL